MQSQIKEADTYYALSCGLLIKNHHSPVRTASSLSTNLSLLGGSGGIVNSLNFCPALLKSLGCFYIRCVLCSQSMEDRLNEFANFTLPILKAFLEARSHNVSGNKQ